MKQNNYPDDWPDIDSAYYKRSVMLFSAVKKLLSVNLELFADEKALKGDIFLFNHFSRFETFIPQFLLYEKTGAYSCAIASSEFFDETNFLSNYLKEVGVFPHDHPRLFAMLAGQILRGRKVIIFPEGGMVKDRCVIDKKGHYSIYSRIAGNRRKQHTGPAVLGQGVEALKAAIRYAFKERDMERLQHWKEILKFDNLDELLASALKPTLIVPSNITFYPIRSSENLLFKSVEMLSKGMSLRQSEELLIESNIMLKDTDMDIRMGNPVNPCCVWGKHTHYMMDKVASNIVELDDVFKLKTEPRNMKERLLGYYFVNNAKCARNQYMHRIYTNVTINLSHLASTLIMSLIGERRQQISKTQFYTVLYIAIKSLQKQTDIHLHRSLLNPHDYGDLMYGTNSRFDQFICIAKEAELISEQDSCYHFLPKLLADHDFDQIRLKNPIAVYNNEAQPLQTIRKHVMDAERSYHKIDPCQLAAWHFEDEQLNLAFEQQSFSPKTNDAITEQLETVTADPMPFFIQANEPNGYGVLLVHGLLASPAELREYGHYLADLGYTVLGIRIQGHGTSPYALRELTNQQWYQSVQKGFSILQAYCARIFVIGFSTGGALALKLAEENPDAIIGVVAVSVPIKFVNSSFMLVPLVHNTNTFVQWMSSFEGVKPFIENSPEHPDINYHNTPIRALYELRLLIQDVEKRLPNINTPTLLIYADQDPVVAISSADTVFEKLGATQKKLHVINADNHGILMENTDNIWRLIDDFLKQQSHLVENLETQAQTQPVREIVT
ncbi:MAG: alpha/beta fold hydrolase [Gammaproteobacteria bacterium]|jgi:esterase/lipase|nr:alpha/beta fold hydrolase [Gammaproteobacteria bacterium]MBT5221749.1 alpha/beta fold hydrolase [Gammaproteobacteria bacterium]MBT5826451.1 alpha/beta fold hydrolase [Gammaproteobacteria bacterium]MBT6420239.1 alpha/beta fold hydrolase [Gammaproteobacteria bacterium]MBT6575311.1 alpha/beta fold hydrolase [Gammaproteobacteria bacterium]